MEYKNPIKKLSSNKIKLIIVVNVGEQLEKIGPKENPIKAGLKKLSVDWFFSIILVAFEENPVLKLKKQQKNI